MLLYMCCEHEKLKKREKFEKLWLTEGWRAHVALVTIGKDKLLLYDLKYLTEFSHTGDLKVYHSLYSKTVQNECI